MADTSLVGFSRRAQTFRNHWNEVDAARSGSPIVLNGGFGVETLERERDAFLNKLEEIVSLLNDERSLQNQVDALRGPLRDRIAQLRANVEAFLAGSVYVKQLPRVPPKLAGQSVYRTSAADAAEVWARIDGDKGLTLTRPLILPGEIGRERLLADAEALMAAWDRLEATRARLKTVRAERDAIYRAVSVRLTQYKKAVVAVLPVGHILLGTLPE